MGYKYIDSNYMKFRNQRFSYQEMVKIVEEVMKDERKNWIKNHDVGFSLSVISVLNAHPFCFGRKRLENFFTMLFAQTKWMNENPEDLELLAETAKKIGLKFEVKGGQLKLYIGEEIKQNEKTKHSPRA